MRRTGSVSAALGLVASLVFASCSATPAATTPGASASAAPSGARAAPRAATAAPAPPAPATQTPTATRPFTMLVSEPTQGLDPAIALTGASAGLMSLIYEPLIARDADGNFVPAVASAWEVSTDGLTYTFTLQPNGAFSDGSKITTEDVRWSLERARASETYKTSMTGVTAIEAVNDTTVTIKVGTPSSVFLRALANPYSAAILSKAAVEADPDYFTVPNATSGAWVLTEYVTKSHATLQANEHYWNAGYPKIQTINYTFSGDQSTRAAAIESGSADWSAVGYNDAQRIRKEGKFPVVESDELSTVGFGFDRTKPPFSDQRVRQAVAFAIDREARKELCWFGTGAAAWGGTLRPWDPNYVEITSYQVPRDEAVRKAGELLDAAGWKLDASGLRVSQGVEGLADGTAFEVTIPYEGNWDAAECHTLLLQQDLKDLGIAVTPQSYDPAAFWGDVAAGKFTMWHMGNGGSDAVDWYLQNYHSKGGATALITKATGEYDALIDEAVTSADPARVKAIFSELERRQAEEVPVLVDGFQFGQIATSPGVSGYRAIPGGQFRGLIKTGFNP